MKQLYILFLFFSILLYSQTQNITIAVKINGFTSLKYANIQLKNTRTLEVLNLNIYGRIATNANDKDIFEISGNNIISQKFEISQTDISKGFFIVSVNEIEEVLQEVAVKEKSKSFTKFNTPFNIDGGYNKDKVMKELYLKNRPAYNKIVELTALNNLALPIGSIQAKKKMINRLYQYEGKQIYIQKLKDDFPDSILINDFKIKKEDINEFLDYVLADYDVQFLNKSYNYFTFSTVIEMKSLLYRERKYK